MRRRAWPIAATSVLIMAGKAGMIVDLAETYGVDLKSSVMVGDQEIDRECAAAGGVGEFVLAKDFFRRRE